VHLSGSVFLCPDCTAVDLCLPLCCTSHGGFLETSKYSFTTEGKPFYCVSETLHLHTSPTLYFGFVTERLEVFPPLPLLLCKERRVFLSNRPPGLSFLSSREVRNWCNPIVFGEFRLSYRTPSPSSLYPLCCYITKTPFTQKDLTTLQILFSRSVSNMSFNINNSPLPADWDISVAFIVIIMRRPLLEVLNFKLRSRPSVTK